MKYRINIFDPKHLGIIADIEDRLVEGGVSFKVLYSTILITDGTAQCTLRAYLARLLREREYTDRETEKVYKFGGTVRKGCRPRWNLRLKGCQALTGWVEIQSIDGTEISLKINK